MLVRIRFPIVYSTTFILENSLKWKKKRWCPCSTLYPRSSIPFLNKQGDGRTSLTGGIDLRSSRVPTETRSENFNLGVDQNIKKKTEFAHNFPAVSMRYLKSRISRGVSTLFNKIKSSFCTIQCNHTMFCMVEKWKSPMYVYIL